jgi:hypothetical protein
MSRLAVKLDVRALEFLSELLCLVVDPLRFVRAGHGSKFSADRHAVATVQFSYVVSGHKIKKANKWMIATAGAALLVYSESCARRARSFAFDKNQTASNYQSPMYF